MKSAIDSLGRASLVLAAVVLLSSCGGEEFEALELVVATDADPDAAMRPQVTLAISNGAEISGSLVITLLPEHAPVTVANFLAYVNSGFYTNTIIHRHEANFVMQGGGYSSPVAPSESPAPKPTNAPIVLEVKVSNVMGTVAMARRSVRNSATSEFFINLVNNNQLDTQSGGYAAFGYITDFTLVNAMKLAPCVTSNVTGANGLGFGCLPVPNLVITSAMQTR